MKKNFIFVVIFCAFFVLSASEAFAQDIENQRERSREMLKLFREDIKENYYDPAFRGINLETHFNRADDQIAGAATGDQMHGIIARSLLAFGDSHTFFIPPLSAFQVDYGWEMQMIGDKCLVTSVATGSDAASKGLTPGDQALSVFDIPIRRDNIWEIKYLFRKLRPLKAIVVDLQLPGGKTQKVELFTNVRKTDWGTVNRIEEEQKYSKQFYSELSGEVFYWKMPGFDSGEKGIDDMIKRVGSRAALILDLRGNGGGYEKTLMYLLGYFFDRDLKIGDRKGRKESKPIIARTRGDRVFKGKLVVLVDSESASASELFARMVQLEKRGTVIGDVTSGSVTEARVFSHDYFRRKGFQVSAVGVTYSLSLTVNDVIMPDGKSLERVGVTPDEIILPAPADLAANVDAGLSRAIAITGMKITAAPAK